MSRQLIVFSNRRRMIAKLPREDRGDLFLALIDYNETGELPEGLSDLAQYAFDVIQEDIDNNAEYYADVSEKRREAGRLGGLKKAENKRAREEQERLANVANANFAKENVANVAKHYTLNPKPKALNICLEQESNTYSNTDSNTYSNTVSEEYDSGLIDWMYNAAAVNERRTERRSAELFSGMPF